MLDNLKQPLIDVQSHADARGIALHKVGVKNVEVPIYVLQKDGRTQMVAASITISVDLPAEQKGTHMSRFVIQLAEKSTSKAFCYNLRDFLRETQQRLKSNTAHIEMNFRYFIHKEAPVTKIPAPVAYQCSFGASLTGEEDYKFVLGLEMPIATLCPCSKAISDYGAHNQRAIIRAKLALDTQSDYEVLWLEDLVKAFDECASCPIFPVLKREDEKYVTERAYDNPKFVEDVIRECVAVLQTYPSVTGYELEVEALESIHGHNAWAYQQEGDVTI